MKRIQLILIALALSFTISVSIAQEDTTSGRWAIRSERPAARWEDAFVTGNGRQGTMVMSRPGSERIICVHEELTKPLELKAGETYSFDGQLQARE